MQILSFHCLKKSLVLHLQFLKTLSLLLAGVMLMVWEGDKKNEWACNLLGNNAHKHPYFLSFSDNAEKECAEAVSVKNKGIS